MTTYRQLPSRPRRGRSGTAIALLVAAREVRQNLRRSRFWIGTVLALAMSLLVTWVELESHESELRRYRERSAQHAATLERVHVYSQLQPVVSRRPTALAVLASGISRPPGSEIKIHLYSIPTAAGSPTPERELGGHSEIDLTAVVVQVLGLLALLITFDAVQEERRRGTLRAILLQGVGERAVVAGKYLGGLASIAIPLTACYGAALAVLLTAPTARLQPGDGWRLLGLAAVYLTYLSSMVLIGLLISVSLRRAPVSLMVAMAVWLATVFLLPGGARQLADALYPADAAYRRTLAQQEALEGELKSWREATWRHEPRLAVRDGHQPSYLRTAADGGVLYRFGSSRFYDAATEYFRRETRIGREYAEAVYRHWSGYERRLDRARRLAELLALPSPAFLTEQLAQDLAGTAIQDHDRFLAACRDHRLQLIGFLEQRRALSSWRWFTDDPPATNPWTGLLGLAPEEVPPEEFSATFERLNEPEVAVRAQRLTERFESDPARLLQLGPIGETEVSGPPAADPADPPAAAQPRSRLPELDRPRAGFSRLLGRIAPQGTVMLLLNLTVFLLVRRRFEARPQ